MSQLKHRELHTSPQTTPLAALPPPPEGRRHFRPQAFQPLAPKPAEDLNASSVAPTELSGICDGMAKLLTVPGARRHQGECKAPSNQARQEWLQFLKAMDEANDHEPEYIFRAHIADDPDGRIRSGQEVPQFQSQIRTSARLSTDNIPLLHDNLKEYKIENFLVDLEKHLKKEKKKFESPLISTSGDIQWSTHKAGQRSKDIEGQLSKVAGLAIFRTKSIRQHPRATLLNVEHVLSYLDHFHNGSEIIEQQLRYWVSNCKEHISWGFIPSEALVSWVTWEELYSPKISFLLKDFYWSFTIGVLRKNHRPEKVDLDSCADRITKFATLLAGDENQLASHFERLIINPGTIFWGYDISRGDSQALRSRLG
ncbi:MAG: hypothetical protein M1840_000034 [Geoglossum simile]|nr:MAG: hypothetical protein M1840_000034 [Geoglossum simile]